MYDKNVSGCRHLLLILRYKHLKSENANEVTSKQNIFIAKVQTTLNILITLQKQACCQFCIKILQIPVLMSLHLHFQILDAYISETLNTLIIHII